VTNIKDLTEQIEGGQRISVEDAAYLWNRASDQELQTLSTLAKSKWHAPRSGSYLIMAILNYTNVCVAKCDYCAFYRLPHQDGTYLLNFQQICDRIEACLSWGGTLVAFNGGFHPKLKIQDYAELFSRIREKYQNKIEFFGMTVAEFMFACKVSKVSYEDGAKLLASLGSNWVTGGGAEILEDGFRMRHSPGKFKVDDYYSAQKAILDHGLGSTATMVIGFDETLEERLTHLQSLRDFQDKQIQENKPTLPSFLCWTYKPYNTELGGKELDTKSYLRWLAVCRLYLDNIENIRTSVLTKNEDALLGLEYGANDFDLPTEDEVTEKAGATINKDFESILEFGRSRGLELTHRKVFAHSPKYPTDAEGLYVPAVIDSSSPEAEPTRTRPANKFTQEPRQN
jgi:cyclic dehypoxanthinyl futalosine synthase